MVWAPGLMGQTGASTNNPLLPHPHTTTVPLARPETDNSSDSSRPHLMKKIVEAFFPEILILSGKNNIDN